MAEDGNRRWWSDADQPGPPIGVPDSEIDLSNAVHAQHPLPVWVLLRFDDVREPHEAMGFALGWTREHVRVQVIWRREYFLGALEFWVEAKDVRRREITPSWPKRG